MLKLKRPLRKSRIIVGMRVTCRERVEAYYSGRNGNPVVYLEPGTVGIVGAVDVPCTTYAYRIDGGTATFVCVDFEQDGKTWRAALYYNNIAFVK